jgi:predicted DNA-binding transcriptional regulator YafY
MSNKVIIAKFMYTNYKGETKERKIEFESISFISNPGFGYQPGWFINGYCFEKNARRSFALSRVIINEGCDVPSHYTLVEWKDVG